MSARTQSVQAPERAQVNLLPPEVKAARGLARLRRWLAFLVLAALLAAAGVVVLATMEQDEADGELADVQAETDRLQAERAEFAEVPVVRGAVDRALRAREIGMSTEILWRPYLHAIAATAPEGVRIADLRYDGATPMTLPAGPADALSAWSVGTISFTAQSATLFDTEAWLRALTTVPGFADPWFSSATLTSSEAEFYYSVTATVQVNEQAYALRFPAVLPGAEEE